MKLAFAGAGRAGAYLARAFHAHRHEVAVVFDTDRKAAERLAREVGAEMVEPRLWDAVSVDAAIIAVPDRAIAGVAGTMGVNPESPPAVFHLSGACDHSVLKGAASRGATCCSMHPLRSFAAAGSTGEGCELAGTRFALEGDRSAIETARQLLASVGAVPFEIAPGQKPAYHAAACLGSNYLVTLAALVREITLSAGLPGEAWEGYMDLMRGTLANIAAVDPGEALTGPIVRADGETLERHREALRGFPQIWETYCQLGRATCELALREGHLTETQAGQMSEILKRE